MKSAIKVSKLAVIIGALIGVNIVLFLLINNFSGSIQKYNNGLLVLEQQSGLMNVLRVGISKNGLTKLEVKEIQKKIGTGLVAFEKGESVSVGNNNLDLPSSLSLASKDTLENIKKSLFVISSNLDKLSTADSTNYAALTSVVQDNVSPVITQLKSLAWLFNQQRKEKEKECNIYTLLLGGQNALLLFFLWRVFMNDFKNPIEKIRIASSMVASGDLSVKTSYHSKTEIGQVAEAIDRIIDNQIKLASFVEEIGEGNFSVKYDSLSDKDKLGISLMGMRDKLQKVNAEEKRRSWANEGYAKFSEILRSENDTKVLGEKILLSLVKYVNANQGALFVVNNEDQNNIQLSLASAYAWDRKKYMDMSIAVGEGLIGQTYQEGETIYLTDVPSDFFRITSGLGAANPTAILIVPLKLNDSIHGVLELAFFRELERFEIDFIERLAESMASTLSSAKVNERTVKLLEESRRMTQEMKIQEEELRQNMEELELVKGSLSNRLAEARNEMEMQIREIETEKIKNEGILEGCVDGVISFDKKGEVGFFNKSAQEITGYSREEIIGKNISELISLELVENHGDFSAFFIENDQKRMISIRTEVSLKNKAGEGIPVLFTLSKTKIDNDYYFTAFVQSIAVELF